MKHGNNRREKMRRLQERCEVSFYVAPKTAVEIAAERTEGMVVMFLRTKHNGMDYGEHVGILAESCYMQGVRDAADALAQSGCNPETPKEPRESAISL